jgi:hypothetical protein
MSVISHRRHPSCCSPFHIPTEFKIHQLGHGQRRIITDITDITGARCWTPRAARYCSHLPLSLRPRSKTTESQHVVNPHVFALFAYLIKTGSGPPRNIIGILLISLDFHPGVTHFCASYARARAGRGEQTLTSRDDPQP